MQYGNLPGIDKPISRLVQGTVMVQSSELDWSFRLLDEVYELGCNTFDTAHAYGSGDNERTVGRWVRERGIRDEVVIVGKGAHPNADRDKRVTPYDITADLHDSLARFQFDEIDLYLLHRDDPEVPVGPLIETLNEHREAGRIRAYGLSNWGQERIQEALAYAAAHGLTPPVASSPHFSLAEQVTEPWPGCVAISGRAGVTARAWYGQTQMALFTWSSLAGGFFSGRFERDNLDEFSDYLDKVCIAAYACEDNFGRLERAMALGEEKGLTLAQVAMAYVFSQPLNIFAIVGCRTGAEFVANVTAAEVTLSEREVAWLESGAGV